MGQIVKGKVDITKMMHDQRDNRSGKYTRGASLVCRCATCGVRKVCVRERVAMAVTIPMCRGCRER